MVHIYPFKPSISLFLLLPKKNICTVEPTFMETTVIRLMWTTRSNPQVMFTIGSKGWLYSIMNITPIRIIVSPVTHHLGKLRTTETYSAVFWRKTKKEREYGICMWYVCESGFLVKNRSLIFHHANFLRDPPRWELSEGSTSLWINGERGMERLLYELDVC